MGSAVISVHGLGKQYLLREGSMRSHTLRGWLDDVLSRPQTLADAQASAEQTFWALRDISFDIEPGEVVGIIGRNGVGKSTLLKILARITEPTEGTADLRGRVSALLEVGTGFHGELTGRENIYLSGAILGMRRAEVDRRFEEIVAFAELQRFLDMPVKRYSSGMYVRLGFAVAAHLDPDILLVDEVLAVGDLAFQRKCLGQMDQAARSGRTVLFVSHQMTAVRRLCSKVIWLDGGKVRATGPTGEVIARYESESLGGGTTSGQEHETAAYQARYTGWSLQNDGAPDPHTINNLKPLDFRLAFDVRENIAGAYGGFEIFDLEGDLVWSANSADQGRGDLQLQAGAHAFVFHLPMLPIKPGAYKLHASLYRREGRKLMDDWWAMPELVVATPPLSHPQDEWQGMINLPCEFRAEGGQA
jgi:lipopolysaccharide transport system ATP-binding protein